MFVEALEAAASAAPLSEAESIPYERGDAVSESARELLRMIGETCMRRARDGLGKRIGRMLINPDGLFKSVGDSRITRARIAAYLGVSRYLLSKRLNELLIDENENSEGKE